MKGQCFCGNVRWETRADPTSVHYCHCTMCRKWTGAPFAALVWFKKDAVHWLGNNPKNYRSSPIAQRAHCEDCGSPICISYDDGDQIGFAAGTVVHPESLVPTHHYGIGSKLDWAILDMSLPAQSTRERW